MFGTPKSRRPKRPHARASTPLFEALEGRRMMSAAPVAAAVKGGILTVTGTAGADTITLGVSPTDSTQIVVDINHKTYSFARKGIKLIKVDGKAGNDFIGVDPTAGDLGLGVKLIGGPGNDTLIGGAKNDSLDGGAGDDTLLGRGGNDTLVGGAGNDWIDGGDGNDVMIGGAGKDTFVRAAGSDRTTSNRQSTVLRTPQDAPVQMPWATDTGNQKPQVQQPEVQTPVDNGTSNDTGNNTTDDGGTNTNNTGTNGGQGGTDGDAQNPVTLVTDGPGDGGGGSTGGNDTPPTTSGTGDNGGGTTDVNNEPGGIGDLGTPPVPMYNATGFTNSPDLTQYGMLPILLRDMDRFLASDLSTIDEAKTRAIALEAAAKGVPLVIDQEIWSVDIRNTPADQVAAAVQKMVQLVDLVHAAAPGLKVGYYGALPLRDYWTPVLYLNATKTDPAYAASVLKPKYDAWQAANDVLKPVAERVDFVCPSLYTFYDNPADWAVYAQANIAEAKRYGKPVLPFLWMQYHDSNPTLHGQFIPAGAWKAEVDLARANADGVVIWGGWQQPWDPNAGWWSVIHDELNQDQAAGAIAV